MVRSEYTTKPPAAVLYTTPFLTACLCPAQISNAPITIRDSPRFDFRGLMIDTSRHFMPLKFIHHIIDGMAANRLNVMHWHIVPTPGNDDVINIRSFHPEPWINL